MAAVAPTFDACGVHIVEDPAKGKVVISDRSFEAGQVIFVEDAFVYASWSTNVCDGCEEDKDDENAPCHCDRTGSPKEMYTPALQKDAVRRDEIVQTMRELEGIGEVDRARCILKCLAMFERDPKSLDEVFECACANVDRCDEEATELRNLVPEIYPPGFTNEQMATLIGVFNTNAHELENLGGSGLFLSACRMEHNCSPNCSFTTYDDKLWMTAIRPIKEGEALSIDYGNFFYRPTEERMTSLFETYGFVCTCETCTVQPDTCRSFKCTSPSCTDGAIWPYPRKSEQPIEDPEELEYDWKCGDCGHVPTDEEVDSFEAAEQELLENDLPETVDGVDEYVKTSPLHKRHYLLFWALDAIGCEAAALSSVAEEEEDQKQLAEVWKRIIEYMNVVVPYAHHEKTIYYDNLAQVQVVLGNLNGARDAYRQAYDISCIVSGAECEPTLKLKNLSENPPTTAEEVRKLYANVKRREDEEDDDEEWEDDEEEEATA
ncbi:hypothetical protein Poli38472_009240 [Pythium oligandrum]|uniref:SET domain-containing protein n=1 Tax=Pythium oligandrum TaxID=41045 RepID=A0A8K1CLC5_PYTOL|nr:hypothetical protein Poli38472_009240 [Pythium oligandrum]|eukprot:TMW65073.1 hypothetical protein Poli38472_009240 [Pythium oligandrum]